MKRIALNATEEEEGGAEDAPCRKEKDTPEAFTIAVLGGGAAGKSSLVRRFLYGVYEETGAAPTLYDEYTGRVPFEGAECDLTFLDTAGQEQYFEHRKEAINTAHGFLLVFDVTQRVSFEEMEGYLNEVCRVKVQDSKELPILILANKADTKAKHRAVTKKEGLQFAYQQECPYMEVSASTGTGTEQALTKLLEVVTYHLRPGKAGYLFLAKAKFSIASPSRPGGSWRRKEQSKTGGGDPKKMRKRAERRWCVLERKGNRLAVYQTRRDGEKEEEKRKRVEDVQLSTVLGVREIETSNEQQGEGGETNEDKPEERDIGILLLTPTEKYYLFVDSQHCQGKQMERERNRWLGEVRKYASMAQRGLAVSDGEAYFCSSFASATPSSTAIDAQHNKQPLRLNIKERTSTLPSNEREAPTENNVDKRRSLNLLVEKAILSTQKKRTKTGSSKERKDDKKDKKGKKKSKSKIKAKE